MFSRTKGAATLGVVGAGVLLTACAGGSHGAATTERGPITYVQGKDNSNVVRPLIAKWNVAHPGEPVTFVEQSDQADQQHDDLVKHFQAKDAGYDVVDVDVVWTAEFAAKGWLQPLTGRFALKTSSLLPTTVQTALYHDTLYAAPQSSDAGLLYYRKDLVKTPPATWDEMMSDCAIAKKHDMDCYAGQFAPYEGLTVNAAEAVDTEGGSIVGPDGKTPTVNSPKAKAGLQRLVDAFKNKHISPNAISYHEDQGRQAFESGKLLFLRNWSYVYNLALTDADSKVKDTLGIAPLPGVGGKVPGASSLGGHNAAISVYSAHKATALDFLTFIESEDTQRFYATRGSLAPVLPWLYTDPTLTRTLPYLPTLLTSILSAVPRPVTPYYPAVTTAIENNVFAAVNGDKSVDQAVSDMAAAITSASGS